MSRVGKAPVKIPAGVKVNVSGQTVNVEGPKGKMSYKLHDRIGVEKKDDALVLKRASEEKSDRALHGTSRAIVNNMVTGVTKGFSKELEIRGVGYRGEQKGKA